MTTGMPSAAAPPELTDGHVRLRPHAPSDAARIVEQCVDAESIRWTTVPRPYAVEDAEGFLAMIAESHATEGGHRYWAIEDVTEPGVFLGTIDLRPRGGGSAEVGFGLHPDGRGRGLMSGALRLVARHWFEDGGRQLTWWANRGNFASWRVAWACGFTFDGTVRGYLPMPEGPPEDAWVATLAADDVTEPSLPWCDPPVIDATADGVRLRPWRDLDVEAMEAGDQPGHFMPARAILEASTFPEWLLVRRERMSRGQMISWCIADPVTDRALGEVLLFVTEGSLDDDVAELGYQVLPSARGRGLAQAAARAAVAHAFRTTRDGGLGLRRLVAQTAGDNEASNAVLTRTGFTVWGRESAADVLPNGQAVDALHWELLRD